MVKRFAASGALGTSGQNLTIYDFELIAGSDAATAELADKFTAGGDGLIHLNAGSANAVDRASKVAGLPIKTGGYVTLTGTGPIAVVTFVPTKNAGGS